MGFHKDILQLDSAAEVDKICDFIKKQVSALKRDGVVIGISGGVDSALCSLLCLSALGKMKVLGLILPEKESNPVSAEYAQKHAGVIGLNTITDDITATLEGFGAYTRRDKAIKEIFPEYNNHWKSKLTLPPDLLTKDTFNFFTLKIKDNEGTIKTARLNNQNMRRILAASNTKQITRMMYLNYYAEMNNYLVCGTTNRSEYIQGFFVKYGDGGVDIEPIAHLYKMQVYQLSGALGIIPEIIKRAPGPDTFTYEVTDEEMHFRIPFDILDLLLYAWENKIPVTEVSKALNLTEDHVNRAFRDITSKYNATNYLRLPPLHLGS
jgi:NAD+ synthase